MAREVKSDVVPLQQASLQVGWFRLNLLHAWQLPVEALFVFLFDCDFLRFWIIWSQVSCESFIVSSHERSISP